MDGIVFVVDKPYTGENEGELSVVAGDLIEIIRPVEDDHYYGKQLRTGETGRISLRLGHRREESPYGKMSQATKEEKRRLLVKTIIAEEYKFTTVLKDFRETVITPVNLRDSPFKRSLLADPAVAVSFTLLQEILRTCSYLEEQLKSLSSDAEMAAAYSRFASSLQLFAQYASENAQLLNAMKAGARHLNDFVPERIDVEATLVEPMQHCTTYKTVFQEYIWLTPQDHPDLLKLNTALDSIIAQTNEVEEKIREEEQSWLLLNLQAQFTGNPVIFTPTRRIIHEGEVERLKAKSNGAAEMSKKTYYAHLFNDAFIYSQRNITGGFKLHVAIDLKGATLNRMTIGDYPNAFTLSIADRGGGGGGETSATLRFARANEAVEWFALIQAQIDALKVKRKDKRATAFAANGVNTSGGNSGGSSGGSEDAVSIAGVSDASLLGTRAILVYNFLRKEKKFVETMAAMNVVVVQPLIDASRGAVLSAIKIGGGAAGTEIQDVHSEALFDKNTSSIVSKSEANAIRDALQSNADVKLFLRAAEGIATSGLDFTNALEALCLESQWSETIQVGNYFNSAGALALYNQLKAYADGQQAVLRILRTPPFQQFYHEAENILVNYQGTFSDKIEEPSKKLKQYLLFVNSLYKCTAPNDLDHQPLQNALHELDLLHKEIEELTRAKKNFETLIEIQNCFVNLLGEDPFLQKLASMERSFVKEGDLKKVCRRNNKTFRFWLFNDYLVYGTPLGAGKYKLSRAMDLRTISMKRHMSSDLPDALELLGAEKSFVIIAPSAFDAADWLDVVIVAKSKLMGVPVAQLVAQQESAETAPLWVPDSGSDGCSVCSKPFTFWNRRHHCRKCGSLVCSEHCAHKMVLPHIHKTQQQKICDNCHMNRATLSGPPAVGRVSTTEQPSAGGINPNSAANISAPILATVPVPAGTNATTTSTTPPSPLLAPPPKPRRPESLQKSSSIATTSTTTSSAPPAPPRSPAPTTLPPASTSSNVTRSLSPPPPARPLSPAPSVRLSPAALSTSTGTVPGSGGTGITGHASPNPKPSQRSLSPLPPRAPAPTTAPPPLPTKVTAAAPTAAVAAVAAVATGMRTVGPPTRDASSPNPSPTRIRSPPPPPPPQPPRTASPGVIVVNSNLDASGEIMVGPSVRAMRAALNARSRTPSPTPPTSSRATGDRSQSPSPTPPSSADAPPPPSSLSSSPPPPPPPPPPNQPTQQQQQQRPQQCPPPPLVAPTAGYAVPVPAPAPASASASTKSTPPTGISLHAAAAVEQTPAAAPPPPPAPPSQLEDEPVDDHLAKFRKMKTMLPEGAVRHKMTADGYAASDIDAFLSGGVDTIPPPTTATTGTATAAPGQLLVAGLPQLRPTSTPPPPPSSFSSSSSSSSSFFRPSSERPTGNSSSLMQAIVAGAHNLKAVRADDPRMSHNRSSSVGGSTGTGTGSTNAITGGGGLLGMLAKEMSKRRIDMMVDNTNKDSDSDSDSGFSDSDSD